jgi:hypothetical protein
MNAMQTIRDPSVNIPQTPRQTRDFDQDDSEVDRKRAAGLRSADSRGRRSLHNLSFANHYFLVCEAFVALV